MQGVGGPRGHQSEHPFRCAASPKPDAAVQEMIWMYRDRLIDLRRDRRLKLWDDFQERGEAAARH